LSLLASACTIERAHAAAASASITVSATVEASCLAAIAPLPAYSNALPAVSVACSNSALYIVRLPATSSFGIRSTRDFVARDETSMHSPALATDDGVILVVVTY
jgi:hypothetical protein